MGLKRILDVGEFESQYFSDIATFKESLNRDLRKFDILKHESVKNLIEDVKINAYYVKLHKVHSYEDRREEFFNFNACNYRAPNISEELAKLKKMEDVLYQLDTMGNESIRHGENIFEYNDRLQERRLLEEKISSWNETPHWLDKFKLSYTFDFLMSYGKVQNKKNDLDNKELIFIPVDLEIQNIDSWFLSKLNSTRIKQFLLNLKR